MPKREGVRGALAANSSTAATTAAARSGSRLSPADPRG